MSKRLLFAGAAFISALFTSASAGNDKPIELTIEAPGATSQQEMLLDRIRGEVHKIRDRRLRRFVKRILRNVIGDALDSEEPILFEDGYNLQFRLSAPDAEAVHKWRRSGIDFGPDYDVLVLTDPDECLDLSQTVPADLFPLFTPNSLEDCNAAADPGYTPDETFINFHIDPFDSPRTRDSGGGFCRESVRERLVDDAFGAEAPINSNKVYVDPQITDPGAGIGPVFAVGPNTGGTPSTFDPTDLSHEDCYGYGADDDLPSLVVMANIGASRIFNEDLQFTDGRIRNMAGLLSGVGFELIDGAGASSIIARMPVTPNMLRPLNFVDLPVPLPFGGPFPPNFNITTQNDDIEVITPVVGATSSVDVVDAVLSSFPDDYQVTIRAVVVEGRAPEFIDDINNDGVFDASDVVGMGFTLLSNEDSITVTHLNFQARAIQDDSFECPTSSTPFGSDQLLYVDLDGDGSSEICQDGDGTASSGVRRPR